MSLGNILMKMFQRRKAFVAKIMSQQKPDLEIQNSKLFFASIYGNAPKELLPKTRPIDFCKKKKKSFNVIFSFAL